MKHCRWWHPSCGPTVLETSKLCVRLPLKLRNDQPINMQITFFSLGAITHCWVLASSFQRFVLFLDHIQRHTAVGRTPLDEWSARRKDLYLITHNTHNRQTSMPSVGFAPTIPVGERPYTYALDRAATGTVHENYCYIEIKYIDIIMVKCKCK
jgi:hypothetical protein